MGRGEPAGVTVRTRLGPASTMKIYIAARNLDSARHVKQAIEEAGHECCARWIDEADPEIFGTGHEYSDVERRRQATTCLVDILCCDVLIHLAGGPGRGGRHAELGFAIGTNKHVIHVGARENVFHWCHRIWHAADVAEAVKLLEIVELLGKS
jgi:hypothetical protein